MNRKMQILNRRGNKGKIRLCLVVLFMLSSIYGINEAHAESINRPFELADQQQKKMITGLVVDNQGEAIIGASVKEKGTTNGTITGIDGDFTLTVTEGGVLEVSYLGFLTQTVNVRNSNTVRVQLLEDSQSLDEVVVTGFGLSQKKVTLSGAISTISSTDIERSTSSTTSGALVGKIAGLNTRQTSGKPGDGVEMSIRNMGKPLYVIDGIQSDEGQFNNIDFNDIESLAVLKDASAAIYGVRAANGVIVATTKKGKRNTKNTVSINAYYGWQNNFKFADQADAKSYVKSYVQAETLSGGERRYDKAEYDKWMDGSEKGYQSFDWYDYIWKSGPQYYTNINFSGGAEKSNYYVSIGHLNQDATVRNYGGFKRTNIQMNIDVQVSDRFKIGTGLNGRIETRKNPGVPGSDDSWLPRFAVFRNLPTKGPYANGNPLYPQKTGDDTQTNFAVMNYATSGYRKEEWRIMQLQANAEYDLFKGLKAKAMASYYFANRIDNIFEYPYKLYRYDAATDTYPVDFEVQNPYRERINAIVEEITTNVQLAYDGKFEGHSIAAIAGLETIKRRDPRSTIYTRPVSNNLDLLYFQTARDIKDVGDNTQARMGWVGRVNYNYVSKYLLELSGRYDGSWKFPENHRWGFFPSASVGWRISEEAFWQNGKLPSIINDLKLRVSYGLVGDDDMGEDYKAFGYLNGYDYKEGGSVIDGAYVVGARPRGIPVTTLSWIKAKIFDVGFDIGLLNNRLTAQADYFNRVRTGLTASRYDVLLPSEVGFELPKENLNSDVHRGIDMLIRWSDKINELNYSVAANATYARFYDWEQYDTRKGNSWDVYRNNIYKRFGHINWGLEAIGQFQSWEEIANYTIDNDRKGNTTLMPGDIKYKDINGDGVINSMDERPIGYRQDATPIFNFGFNFAFNWRNFDLSFDFSGSALNSYWQRYEQQIPFQNNGNSPMDILNDSWHLSDIWDANSEIIPGKHPMVRLNMGEHSNYWNSTYWKHNVKYLKLRNLEFGYNIPKNILAKANISVLRVYISGSNLFAISNVRGVDPEQKDENGLGYPTMRVVNVGLNLKF